MPFKKGQSGNPKGRKPGVPNKASLPWKELAVDICQSPEHQAALRAACLTDPRLMVAVAEHAFGKPKFTGEVRVFDGYVTPGGDDVGDDAEDPVGE